jgi:effector-binding domain-containing protein
MRDARGNAREEAARIDPPWIVQTERVRTAVIHLTVPRKEIQKVMGPGHEELMATLRNQGITPAGPWFTHHLRMDPAIFDYEIGVPVTRPVTAAGRVTPGELPAATVARTFHHGAYDGLATAWPDLDAWVIAQGRRPGPSLWEVYLTDPKANPDPATWRTELDRPLVG